MPHRIFDTSPSIQLATYLVGIFGWLASRAVHLAEAASPAVGSVTDMAGGGSIAVITSGVVMSLIQLARYIADLKYKNAEADREERDRIRQEEREKRDHDARLAEAERKIEAAHRAAKRSREEAEQVKADAARAVEEAKAEAHAEAERAKAEALAIDKELRHKLRGEFDGKVLDLQVKLLEAAQHRATLERQIGIIDHRDVAGINRNTDHIARVAEVVDPSLDVSSPHVLPLSGSGDDIPSISDNGPNA